VYRGVDLTSDQETKTKKALEFFSKRLHAKEWPLGEKVTDVRGPLNRRATADDR
jgi:hypothetical protein